MNGNVDLSAFDGRHVQVLITMLNFMRKHEIITIEKAIEILRKENFDRTQSRRASIKKNDNLPRCSKCGGPVSIERCNACKRTVVPGGYTKVHSCTNINCLHQEYYK